MISEMTQRVPFVVEKERANFFRIRFDDALAAVKQDAE